jgi:hypothetical protein
MRLDVRLLVLCGAIFLVAAEVPPALQRNDAPVFDINIAIRPATAGSFQLLRLPKRGEYVCEVFIHEVPGSTRVWGPKPVLLSPGQSGESSVVYAGLKATVSASLSGDLVHARAAVTITRDEKIVSRQVSLVTLQKPVVR